ncbi:MAG: SDR family oxidoreductase, partial [Acidobacteriota bacterium]
MSADPLRPPIVITGASSGIGRSLALAWASSGTTLVLIARRREPLEQVAGEARKLGAETTVMPADVTRADEIGRAAQQIVSRWGAPWRLVCSAGQLEAGTAHPLDVESVRRLMETNLLGTARAVDAFAPHMTGGTIVLLASMVARHPFEGLTPYALSKWALDGYHRALSSELAARGVRVSIVYPSIVDTPMVSSLLERAGDGAPAVYRAFPARDADRIARRIMQGVERGRRRIFVAAEDRFLDVMLRLA